MNKIQILNIKSIQQSVKCYYYYNNKKNWIFTLLGVLINDIKN